MGMSRYAACNRFMKILELYIDYSLYIYIVNKINVTYVLHMYIQL